MSKRNIPNLSSDFTIDDIHKIREHNYEATKDMTFEERKAYYDEGAKEVQEAINKLREEKKSLKLS